MHLTKIGGSGQKRCQAQLRRVQSTLPLGQPFHGAMTPSNLLREERKKQTKKQTRARSTANTKPPNTKAHKKNTRIYPPPTCLPHRTPISRKHSGTNPLPPPCTKSPPKNKPHCILLLYTKYYETEKPATINSWLSRSSLPPSIPPLRLRPQVRSPLARPRTTT